MDSLTDLKRLSGLNESVTVNEADVSSIDDAISVLSNLRQTAKNQQLTREYTAELANSIVEDLYPVILLLDKIKRTGGL
jgi:hypothetical protein